MKPINYHGRMKKTKPNAHFVISGLISIIFFFKFVSSPKRIVCTATHVMPPGWVVRASPIVLPPGWVVEASHCAATHQSPMTLGGRTLSYSAATLLLLYNRSGKSWVAVKLKALIVEPP